MNPTNVFIDLSHQSLPVVKILDFNVSKIHSVDQMQEMAKLFTSLGLGKEKAY